MSVTNTVVSQQYNGDDLTTSFAIPFDFTSTSVIKVYLIEGSTKTLQTLTTHYSLTGGPPVTTVEMVTAPTAAQDLLIVRETPKTQESSFSGTSFPASSVEELFDNMVRIIQEVGEDVGKQILLNLASSLSNIRLPIEAAHKFIKWNNAADGFENSAAIPTWAAGNTYAIGDIVINSTTIYKCNTAHTAAIFDSEESYWDGVSGARGEQGIRGEKGIKGDTGPIGATGPAGANGGNGADGIFSAIASQAEAQAGTENTKGMTALRTKEAIASQVPNLTIISTLQTKDTEQDTGMAALGDRISRVETLITSSNYTGSQDLLNGQAVALPLLGASVPEGSEPTVSGGKNSRLTVDADGTRFVEGKFEIWRKDDAEERLITVDFILLYINSTWHFTRKSTNRILGNFDGVTFSLVQTGNAATVYYISDTMSGGNYDEDSRIKWVANEVSIGV